MYNRRNMNGIVLASLFCIILAHESTQAQSFSLGIKVGVPATDTVGVSPNNRAADKRYKVGPVAEIRLPLSFAVEASALYQRIGYYTASGFLGVYYFTKVRANSWEIPIVVKRYIRLGNSPVRPYVSCGYTLKNLSGVSEVVHNFGVDYGTGAPFDTTFNGNTAYILRDNPIHGVTAGGGVSFRLHFLRVSPEVRYTRWSGGSFQEAGSFGSFVESNRNQLDLLVGLTF